MKKTSTAILVMSFLYGCSQKNDAGERFDSKFVKLLPDTTKMMLIENVIIRYGDLYVEADSALLEKPRQLVTAYGIKKAIFKGEEVNRNEFSGHIRYKKGDAKFYTD